MSARVGSPQRLYPASEENVKSCTSYEYFDCVPDAWFCLDPPNAMAVLGSDISIDLHIVGDVEIDTIRGVVQKNGRLRSALAEDLRQAIEDTTREILRQAEIADCTVTVDLNVVKEKVPGALRQRVSARLDVEGDRSTLAAVDDAVGPPERAHLASATEDRLDDHLADQDLTDVVGSTVIVTPVQFR